MAYCKNRSINNKDGPKALWGDLKTVCEYAEQEAAEVSDTPTTPSSTPPRSCSPSLSSSSESSAEEDEDEDKEGEEEEEEEEEEAEDEEEEEKVPPSKSKRKRNERNVNEVGEAIPTRRNTKKITTPVASAPIVVASYARSRLRSNQK